MGYFKAFSMAVVLTMAGCGKTPVEPVPVANGSFEFESGGFDTLFNRARSDHFVGALQVSPKLRAVAQAHANDMARGGFFSHNGSDGRSVGQRVAATGYGHCWVSENISWNRKSESEAFARWMASPGHRRNMLAPEPTEYGLATTPDHYRVLILARPGC